MRILFTLIALLIFIQGFSQDLFSLVKNNEYKSVKTYIGAVNLRDTNQATPLMWAVYKSDLRMVRLLIRKGADVNLKGWIIFKDSISRFDFIYGSCLAAAAGENKVDQVRYFIRKLKIPVDDREIFLNDYKEEGWTALQWASVKGNNRSLKYLIRQGANINAVSVNDYNQSPLLFAINFHQIEAAKILIDKGADVNQKDLFGVAPLTYALEIQSRELVKSLVKHGAILEENNDRPLEEMLLDLFGVSRIEDL
jgi:ankyrin repeat protein